MQTLPTVLPLGNCVKQFHFPSLPLLQVTTQSESGQARLIILGNQIADWAECFSILRTPKTPSALIPYFKLQLEAKHFTHLLDAIIGSFPPLTGNAKGAVSKTEKQSLCRGLVKWVFILLLPQDMC